MEFPDAKTETSNAPGFAGAVAGAWLAGATAIVAAPKVKAGTGGLTRVIAIA